MRNFNKVFYRAAATPITSATKGGTYPDWTFSGWTLLVGAVAEGAMVGIEQGDKGALGDGSELTEGEKLKLSVVVKNFTAANLATIRAALLNVKCDFMVIDSEQPNVAYVVHGIRAYPAPDFTSGKEPTITITGERKVGSGLALFSPVTVS